jgi:ribose transport system permease protein
MSVETEDLVERERRSLVSPNNRSLAFVLLAIAILGALGALFAPSSISRGAILGMLPFASVLAVAALGQTLVIQQGGIDLSVPGAISLTVVVTTHQADGDDSRLLMAASMALGFVLVAGVINGYLIGRRGLNPIIATLGTNALLYAVVLGISQGIPRGTTDLLASIMTGRILGVPKSVYFATAATAIVTLAVKKMVSGRRFEAVGANTIAAWAAGLRARRHGLAAYVWAMVLYWLAGVMLAGIVAQPTAFQGDAYLLATVAAVVLGGTSLLGGRGYPVATVFSALFLTQLDQFVFALGVTTAIRTLVEASALAAGVALHTIDWSTFRERLASRRSAMSAS